MRLSRPQFQLSTLLAVVLLAGLAMGYVRAWRQREATMPSGGFRIASEVVATRAARSTSGGSDIRDAAPLAAFVTAALSVPSLWRRLRGR